MQVNENKKKNRKEKPSFWLLLVFSSVLHLLFILLLSTETKQTHHKKTHTQGYRASIVKLTTLSHADKEKLTKNMSTPLKEASLASSEIPRRSMAKSPSSHDQLKASQKTAHRLNYASLLDISSQAHHLSLDERALGNRQPDLQSLSKRFGVKEAQQIELNLGEFAGNFFIPYAYRNMTTPGKANAQLQIKQGQRLYLLSLNGEPYLRAVLYAALQEQSNHELLHELAFRIHSNSLRVKLCFKPKWSERDRSTQHETKWQLRASTLVITQHFYLNAAKAGGIGLKDKQVEKDKAWDQQALRKLSQSPAFRHPLRHLFL